MTEVKVLEKLKEEFQKLNIVSDMQFEERFNTVKNQDSWVDELFRKHQECRIRIDLLLEMVE